MTEEGAVKIQSARRLKDLFFPVFSIYKLSISEDQIKLYIMRKTTEEGKKFRLLQIFNTDISPYGLSTELMREIAHIILDREVPEDFFYELHDVSEQILTYAESSMEREYEEDEERMVELPYLTRLLQGELFSYKSRAYFYLSREPNQFGFYEGGLLRTPIVRTPKYGRAKTRHLSKDVVELLQEVLYTTNQYIIRQQIPQQMFTQRWYDEYQALLVMEDKDLSLIDREVVYPRYFDYVVSRIIEEMPTKTVSIGRNRIDMMDTLLPIYLDDLFQSLREIDKYRVVQILRECDYFKIEDSFVTFQSPTLEESLGLKHLDAERLEEVL